MPTAPKWLTITNEGSNYQVRIHGLIGDTWDISGVTFQTFLREWEQIPVGAKIDLHIFSDGGSVFDGIAIYNLIAKRRADVTCHNDGKAFSTAGWIMCAGSKAVSSKAARFLYHNPMSYLGGDSRELRKAADELDKIKQDIVDILVDKCGKKPEEVWSMMEAETIMNGVEAQAYGFVDELTEEAPIENCAPIIPISVYRFVPVDKTADCPPPNQTPTNTMRETLLKILNGWGVQPPKDASDADLQALVAKGPPAAQAQNTAPPVDVANLAKQIADLQAANELARQTRIRDAVNRLRDECKITNDMVDNVYRQVLANESLLDVFNALPQHQPGPDPVGMSVVTPDIRNIATEVSKPQRGTIQDRLTHARNSAVVIRKELGKITGAWNTNTIPTELQFATVIQQAMVAFAHEMLPLRAFTRAYNVTLNGNGTVEVPYYALSGGSTQTFSAGTGYNTANNTTTNHKTVTVATRSYRMLNFTSAELAQQPYLNAVQLMALEVSGMAEDIVTNVMGLVTASNFSTAVVTCAADSFDAKELGIIRTACSTAHWPRAGRSCVLKPDYYGGVVDDTAVQSVAASGDNMALREGRATRVKGFDLYEWASLPANSENLVGVANMPSAILFATAPVLPDQLVRNNLGEYRVFVDPDTDLTLTYRAWGDADLDKAKRVVEVFYGKAVGETDALKRITSA